MTFYIESLFLFSEENIMVNLLVNSVKKEVDKKIPLPKILDNCTKKTTVNKFVSYLGKVRAANNKDLDKNDYIELFEKIEEKLTYFTYDDLDDEVKYYLRFAMEKYTSLKYTSYFEKLHKKHFMIAFDKEHSLYRVVYDDRYLKPKGQNELGTFWYKNCPSFKFNLTSYSFLQMRLEVDTSLAPRKYMMSDYLKVYDYIEQSYDLAFAYELNNSYNSNSGKTIATVTTLKKYQDLELNKNTLFNQLGFVDCEIDTEPYQGNKFDRNLFKQLENDWADICNLVPRTDISPQFKVRKLHKHKADGLYYPTLNILAIDVRNSTTFVHEFGHHVDHTFSNDDAISLTSEIFIDLRKKYKNALKDEENLLIQEDKTSELMELRSKWNYYITPTEVFARAFEMWVHETISDKTCLTNGKSYLTEPEYKAVSKNKEEFFNFFNTLFTEHIKSQPKIKVANISEEKVITFFKEVEPTNFGQQLELF